MTYREVMAVMTGASRHLQFQMNMAMRAAWHSAAFERMKKMPRLESILQKDPHKKRLVQTPEQQAMVADQWLRANEKLGFIKVVRDGNRFGTGRRTQSKSVA